jgi:NAD(P)-dependent dehydrogenase (short-subunit alcohol dehydrogenase family)
VSTGGAKGESDVAGTVIITGANSGIGRAAAFRFAREGWSVVMACRSPDQARSVRDAIARDSGSDRVSVMELDMASQRSIRSFAAAIRQDRESLDVLIHNAAYFNHGERYRLGPDGIEIAFGTNVVGPYLLTRLMVDLLGRSDDPRILHAGSNIIKHFFDPKLQLDFDIISGPPDGASPPSVYVRYRQSKMALLMLTFVLARRLASAGIAVNCLQINGARMSRETVARVTWPYRVVARVQNLFFPPPTFMADHYFTITTSDGFSGVTGRSINQRLETMAPASNEGAGFREQLRNALGSRTYPAYADDRDVQEEVLRLCEMLTAEDRAP